MNVFKVDIVYLLAVFPHKGMGPEVAIFSLFAHFFSTGVKKVKKTQKAGKNKS